MVLLQNKNSKLNSIKIYFVILYIKEIKSVWFKSVNGQPFDCLSKNVLLEMSSYDIFWQETL